MYVKLDLGKILQLFLELWPFFNFEKGFPFHNFRKDKWIGFIFYTQAYNC